MGRMAGPSRAGGPSAGSHHGRRCPAGAACRRCGWASRDDAAGAVEPGGQRCHRRRRLSDRAVHRGQHLDFACSVRHGFRSGSSWRCRSVYGTLLGLLAERRREGDGWFARAPHLPTAAPLVLWIRLAPLLGVLLVLWASGERMRRVSRGATAFAHPLVPWAARLRLVAIVTLGLVDLVRDATELTRSRLAPRAAGPAGSANLRRSSDSSPPGVPPIVKPGDSCHSE